MKRYSGFTIVELLIVIVVIAILATISIVAYNGIQSRANNTIVVTNLKNTVTVLENYNAINGRYPMQGSELTSIRNDGFTVKGTLSNTLLYCVDTTNPTSWMLLAYGYPSGTNYRWTSAGERNSNSGVTIGSGTTTCNSQLGISTAMGGWAFQFATVQ